MFIFLRAPSFATWFLIAAVVGATPARANNEADEADVAFNLGNKQYAKRQFEPALAQYFLSYRLVPNHNVLFNIAKCFEELKRFDEAYRYYNDYSIDPAVTDADRKGARQAMARLAARVALISVTSDPAGAELYIDRPDLGSRGKTPLTIAFAAGTHTLLVRLDGYHEASAKVQLTRGRETKQALTLERIVGQVELTGAPPGAVVRETSDGPELGRLPVTLSLVPGSKLLVVQAEGFAPSQVLVEVKAGATVASKVQLVERAKPQGKVVLTADRENALVRVDGKDFGFTPTVLTLPAGPHHLEVTAEEAVPFVREIELLADSEERFNAELKYAPPQVSAASKTALSVDQAPASVTVITREEIQGFGYQTLPEALRAVRGFFFTDDHIYTYAGLRGFSPAGDLNTRLLVLYDGHTVNDVWTGQGYVARDFDIDLNEVDRIEVVRGPASILYGTGAEFGVINVVPRDKLANKRHIEGAAGAGGAGGVKGRVTGSLGETGAMLLLSAAGFVSSGGEFTDVVGSPTVKGLDGERSLGASLRGKWGGFTLTGKFNQRAKQVPIAPHGATLGLAGTQYTDTRGFAELAYQKDLGRVSVSGRLSYDNSGFTGVYVNRNEVTGLVTSPTDSGGANWVNLDLRVGIGLWQGNQLTVSTQGQGQFTYGQFVRVPKAQLISRFVVSGTLLDEWQITPWLFVQAGLRIDKYFDLVSPTFSPRGALVIKPYSTGVTKLVAGQAFRAPNIYELTFNDSNFSVRTAPAGSLQPELITTFEVEHSHNITSDLRATVGGYYNLIDHLVALTPDEFKVPLCNNGTQCQVYKNGLNRFTALGAEAQLRWQPSRFTLVEATYSFVNVSGVPNPDGTASEPPYPMHLASVRAMVPLKEGLLRLSAQGTYQSSRLDPNGNPTGEALVINLGLAGEYGFVRYFAGVQNLLDQRAGLPFNGEKIGVVSQYGRTFWLELVAGF